MNFGPITLTTKYIYIGYRSFFKENPAVGHYNRQTYMSWHHLNPKATHVFWRWDHMCEWPQRILYDLMTSKLIQNSNLCQKRSVSTYAVTTIAVHVVREILWWMESTYLLLQGLAPIPKQGSANMTGKGFWKILVLTWVSQTIFLATFHKMFLTNLFHAACDDVPFCHPRSVSVTSS